MDAIQESLSQLQQIFTQRMDVYHRELQAATPSATVSNLSADFNTFRSFIMTALQSLQEQVRLLTHQVDNMEMRSRRKILLIHGVSEQANEDIAAVISKTITSQLKVTDFSADDIARCHRMGRSSSTDRPRPILVKLRAMEMRSKIWSSKTILKGSGVTLSEFLTKPRHDVFMEARKRFGLNRTWTREGFVFVQGADNERHRVATMVELDKIAIPKASKNAVVVKETTAPKAKRTATKK